jgi:hypothetical protein
MHIVSNFCLSAADFDPNYLKTGQTEWTEFSLGTFRQKVMFKIFVGVNALARPLEPFSAHHKQSRKVGAGFKIKFF